MDGWTQHHVSLGHQLPDSLLRVAKTQSGSFCHTLKSSVIKDHVVFVFPRGPLPAMRNLLDPPFGTRTQG